MDDRKLEIVISAVQSGSLSKAAALCNCSQPAAGKAMDSLESELGCKIVNRDHSGISLTAEGEKLYPSILEAYRALCRLSDKVSALSQGEGMVLRVGSFASAAGTWLADAIVDYCEKNPNVRFDVIVSEGDLSRRLMEDDVDMVIADAPRVRGFHLMPLTSDRYRAVLPEGMRPDLDKVTLEDFDGMPFISTPRNALGYYLGRVPDQSISLICDDDTTLLCMVAKGLGASIVPDGILNPPPKGVRVLPLDPCVTRVIGIALPATPSKLAKEFAGFLQKRFALDS